MAARETQELAQERGLEVEVLACLQVTMMLPVLALAPMGVLAQPGAV